MRIAWYSNSPETPTGYGVQTKQVAERMVRLRSRRSVDKRDGVHFVGRLLCELLQQVLV